MTPNDLRRYRERVDEIDRSRLADLKESARSWQAATFAHTAGFLAIVVSQLPDISPKLTNRAVVVWMLGVDSLLLLVATIVVSALSFGLPIFGPAKLSAAEYRTYEEQTISMFRVSLMAIAILNLVALTLSFLVGILIVTGIDIPAS